MGNAMPPMRFCTLQPYKRVPRGSTKRMKGRLALSLSSGSRCPFLFLMYLLTVMSDTLPPSVLPTKKPAPGAR